MGNQPSLPPGVSRRPRSAAGDNQSTSQGASTSGGAAAATENPLSPTASHRPDGASNGSRGKGGNASPTAASSSNRNGTTTTTANGGNGVRGGPLPPGGEDSYYSAAPVGAKELLDRRRPPGPAPPSSSSSAAAAGPARTPQPVPPPPLPSDASRGGSPHHPHHGQGPPPPPPAGAGKAGSGQALQFNHLASFDANNASVMSGGNAVAASSMADVRPRMGVAEAKELFQHIFSPVPGELECLASQFVERRESFVYIGEFLSAFLRSDMKDRWLVDSVMLTALGRERWRPSRSELNNMTKQQERQFSQTRRECTDRLRERLLGLSGVLVESDHAQNDQNLKDLLRAYKKAKSRERGEDDDHGGGGDGAAAAAGDTQQQQQQSNETVGVVSDIYVARLRSTVGVSFDCYTLLADRIPTALLSSFPGEYFLNAAPVVSGSATFDRMGVGDSRRWSFFVTLRERVRILRGMPKLGAHETDELISSGSFSHSTRPGSASSLGRASGSRSSGGGVGGGVSGGSVKVTIATVAQLYTAMRNLALVVTTACSSMVLKVMFRLAEAIRLRRHFQEVRERARAEHLSLEKLLREDPQLPDVITPYLGNAIDDPEDWKRYVVTEEMSLAVYTRLLVRRFRSETASKLKKLRQKYFNVFAYLEAVASEEESAEFDPARLLSAMVFKIMYLVGGGQRSIEADDKQVPVGSRQSTDDLLLSRMLEVPVLNRICWVANMLGVPVMSFRTVQIQKVAHKPLTFVQADEAVCVMRELFQAVGALPMGRNCPQHFREWLPLFPLYAVNTEGKRIIMYLYSALVSTIKPMQLVVQRDVVLSSFSEALTAAKDFSKAEVQSYVFMPEMTVGYHERGETQSTLRLAERNEARRQSTTSRSSSKDKDKDKEKGEKGEKGAKDSKDTSPRSSRSRRCEQESASDSESSCSTLLDADMNIDAYTCVSPQAQLYMRCANEATERRHKTAELTPFVQTDMYPTVAALAARRPELASLVQHQHGVSALMPSEALLTVRWLDDVPKVTFQPGDSLLVMVERAPRGGSARYFSSPAGSPGTASLGAGGNNNATGGRQRSHSVTIEPGQEPRPSAPEAPTPNSAAAAAAAGKLSEHMRAQQTVMQELMGDKGHHGRTDSNINNSSSSTLGGGGTAAPGDDKQSRRQGARWSIVRCLAPRIGKTHDSLLLVSCLELPLTDALRVVTIGHQRSTISAFYYLDDSSDSCWSNPQLVESLSAGNGGNSNAGTASGRASGYATPASGSVSSLGGAAPAHPLVCRTEDELARIFFALGVMLPNAIANGVFLSIPLAPLAFRLFKKAVETGDYAFRGFMWLEPGDGNLLSPSLVLNSAYEVMTMTDAEYYNFLRSRGLHRPENLVFPVSHSFAEEQARAKEDSDLWNSHHQSLVASRSQLEHSGNAAVDGSGNIVVDDEWRRRKSLSIQRYLECIREHNRTGTMFEGGGGGSSTASSVNNRQPSSSNNNNNNNSTTNTTSNTNNASVRSGAASSSAAAGVSGPLAALPSREEYVSLYLVNDLAWSSVVRGGDGDRMRALWVQLARGVTTSPLAKSPLFSHCCSRVIREVLCMPNK